MYITNPVEINPSNTQFRFDALPRFEQSMACTEYEKGRVSTSERGKFQYSELLTSNLPFLSENHLF